MFFKKKEIAKENIPQHIAFICDGNRRWARKRGLMPWVGHDIGLRALFDKVVQHLLDKGVSTISFFVFSTENWDRDKKEVDFLMKLFKQEFSKYAKQAKEKNIRIKFIGRRDTLEPKIIELCNQIEQDTIENTAGTVVFAFDYSGKNEIVRAAQSAIESGIAAEDLDADTFETFMDSGELLPIDLVVRTSNELRISNFMLWKLAYAELMFIKEHWPEMNKKILDRILQDYTKRTRRFGK